MIVLMHVSVTIANLVFSELYSIAFDKLLRSMRCYVLDTLFLFLVFDSYFQESRITAMPQAITHACREDSGTYGSLVTPRFLVVYITQRLSMFLFNPS